MELVNKTVDSLQATLVVTSETASTGQRFLNFFIDHILIRFTIGYAIGEAAGFRVARIAPGIFSRIFDCSQLPVVLYGIAFLLFYYTLSEGLFRGRTVGKLITRTRAVRADGSALTFKDAFLRSISRAFPLEALSGMDGHPWHDKWTRTMVVKNTMREVKGEKANKK